MDTQNVKRRKYATVEEAEAAKLASRKKYLNSEAGRAKMRAINLKYSQSPKGLAKREELKVKYKLRRQEQLAAKQKAQPDILPISDFPQ